MAERPSVKEILALVRAGGPAKPQAPASAEPQSEGPESEEVPVPAVEEDVEAAAAPEPPAAPSPVPQGRPLSLKEKLAAARNTPAGAAPAAPAAPPAAKAAPAPRPETRAPAPPSAPPAPVEPGRPLTLKEKLAAARGQPGGGAGPAPKPAAAEAPPAQAEDEGTAEEPATAPASASAPSAAALGRPLTLQEKLAAARGGAASSPAPAKPGAKPAAAKPAAAAAPAAKVATARAIPPLEQASDPRDLAEHLRRAGAEKDKKAKAEAVKAAPAAKSAAPKKIESKVVPPRPSKAAATARAAAVQVDSASLSRRVLFKAGFWIAAGWAAFWAGIGAMLVMTGRFMFPNVLAEPPSTIKVGFGSDFEPNQVNERWKAEWGFWIVRSDIYDGVDKIYALSSICTHLGCPPNWLGAEQKFKCPCHGSGFYISGVNFEGPAPRPLERYKVLVGDDGQIVVDKSQKFQEELGQWTDPESFIQA